MKINNIMLTALLVLATFLVFGQVVTHDFVYLDDPIYLINNPILQKPLNFQTIIHAFFYVHDGNWFPITWISHLLDVKLWGYDPAIHHLINVCFHLISGTLVFLLFRAYIGQVSAFLLSLTFLIHPLRAESVAWAAERKDVLSVFFALMTMLWYFQYAKKKNQRYYYAALACFLLALMSKSMVVTLPLVFLLMDIWPLRRLSKENVVKCAIEKVPFLILSACVCFVTLYAHSSAGYVKSVGMIPWANRIESIVMAPIFYIEKLFLPLGLFVSYPIVVSNLNVFRLAAGFFIHVIIWLFAIIKFKKYPMILVGWLWYLLMLLPVSGLIQSGGNTLADRYSYLPLLGVTLSIYAGVDLAAQNVNARKILLIMAILLNMVFMGLGYRQVGYWKNTETLFQNVLKNYPGHWSAHVNLGDYYAHKERYSESITHYQNAIKILPNPDVLVNYANTLFSSGNVLESERVYRQVVKSHPNHVLANLNLANLLISNHKKDEAIIYLDQVIRMDAANERAQALREKVLKSVS